MPITYCFYLELWMHGNTSWSDLYRKMIPMLVDAGYRCFVPDLMGFGLSGNPEERIGL